MTERRVISHIPADEVCKDDYSLPDTPMYYPLISTDRTGRTALEETTDWTGVSLVDPEVLGATGSPLHASWTLDKNQEHC